MPYVNNEIKSYNSSRFRENLLKVDQMILIGGPDDGVITPWQSRYDRHYTLVIVTLMIDSIKFIRCQFIRFIN